HTRSKRDWSSDVCSSDLDWGDIGYNYLVDFMGNVYEGRIGGDNVVGGHAYQYAYGSSGICEMGSFKTEPPTPEALAGLIWITARSEERRVGNGGGSGGVG